LKSDLSRMSRIWPIARSILGVSVFMVGLVVVSETTADGSTPSAGFGEGSGFCASATPNGYTLGASFENVYACGPANNSGTGYFVPASGANRGFFEDASWGFQCTELANRFLFDAFRINPIYGESLDGADFASSVHTKYPTVNLFSNGTVAQPYLPGDIVSFSGGSDGHVAVIMASTYSIGDGGNYGVTLLEENGSSSGETNATVANWSMRSPSDSGEAPTNFLALVAPPAALTKSIAANHVLEVTATGTAYLADSSGVPHWISDSLTYDCYAATHSVLDVTQSEVNALGNGQPYAARCQRAQDAANHLLVVSATNTAYWADSSGVPHWIPTSAIYNCFVSKGVSVISGLVQSQVNALGNGQPWATCTSSTAVVTTTTTAATVGPQIIASNYDGHMAIRLVNFPTGAIHFYCHFGSGFPKGGSVDGPYATTVTSPSESWPTGSGWCFGSGNAWVGVEASNSQDYYSNQVTL